MRTSSNSPNQMGWTSDFPVPRLKLSGVKSEHVFVPMRTAHAHIRLCTWPVLCVRMCYSTGSSVAANCACSHQTMYMRSLIGAQASQFLNYTVSSAVWSEHAQFAHALKSFVITQL